MSRDCGVLCGCCTYLFLEKSCLAKCVTWKVVPEGGHSREDDQIGGSGGQGVEETGQTPLKGEGLGCLVLSQFPTSSYR